MAQLKSATVVGSLPKVPSGTCPWTEVSWPALAMAHHTIRERERLTKLSEGQCDLNDVQAIVDRVVAVSVMALTGGAEVAKKAPRPAAPYGRLTRQDL